MQNKQPHAPNKLYHLLFILLGAVALVLFAFALLALFPKKLTPPEVITPNIQQNSVEKLTQTTWVWQETQLGSDTPVQPKQTAAFTLKFTTESIQLTTDCNNGFGNYMLSNENTITIGQIASTLMYCEGSQESLFFEQLSQVDTYLIDQDTLYLFLTEDSGTMTFVAKSL